MIELLIINSLIIWGVFTSIQEGLIFDWIGEFIRGVHYKRSQPEGTIDFNTKLVDNFSNWIKKPLATCPICMSSFYGTPVFWFAYLTNMINYDYIIIVYICYVFALAGLNYLILTFMPGESRRTSQSDDKKRLSEWKES